MLVQVLLADRKDAGPLVQPYVDKAAGLRAEAEAQARRGDHEACGRRAGGVDARTGARHPRRWYLHPRLMLCRRCAASSGCP